MEDRVQGRLDFGRVVVFWVVLVCLISRSGYGAPIRLVLRPTDDTYIDSEAFTTNYGEETSIKVGRGSLEYRTYLRFDLSRIPDGKSITSARLGLHCHLASVDLPIVGAHYLEDDGWSEDTLTWGNAPVNFSAIATDEIGVSLGLKYWTVTSDVIDAYGSDDVYSVVIKLQDGVYNKWTYYYSKEKYYPDDWPLLEIIYEGIKYGGGSGTQIDPYLIYTAEQMSQIGDNPEDWDKHFKLMSDISLSDYTGAEFPLISTDWAEPFTGVFDGNGHVISNFTYILDGFVNYLGLFGCLGAGSEVRNLGLMYPHVSVSSGNGAGALTGVLYEGGVVRNCWARGLHVSGSFRVGGLVGQVYEGQLINSYAESGEVSVEYVCGGGIVGENADQIIQCYSTCRVGGEGSYLGGLIGYNNGGSVTASFWDKEASGMPYSWGGTGKTTAEMQTESTFTSAGWDFVTPIWTILEGVDYPRLWWQDPVSIIKYGGGSGTEGDPYLIYTAHEMQEIGSNPGDWGAHFKQVVDIDLSKYTGENFNIIGTDSIPFTGAFDGDGHTISGFTYDSDSDNVGLFGVVGASGEIMQLRLVDVNINSGSGSFAGGVAGTNYGSISGCSVSGSIVGGGGWTLGGVTGYNLGDISDSYFIGSVNGGIGEEIGGLVGDNYSGSITNCYARGTVWSDPNSGTEEIGGLAGENGGSISCSWSDCNVVGGFHVGGLVGHNYDVISNCHARGDVEGDCAGGLAGASYGGSIVNCYSRGSVDGSTCAGGLLGDNSSSSVIDSFWDTESSGQWSSAGGTGLITEDMQIESTFTDAGWDFSTPIWKICERQDYPRLWWEEIDCGAYSGGSGTEADPYRIWRAEDLQAIGVNPQDWDAHFKLMTDIDLGGYTGTSFNVNGDFGNGFSGVFDGDGHTISNFTYNSYDESYIGIFGWVDETAEIRNVGMVNPLVSDAEGFYVGSLIGDLYGGKVIGCWVEGGSISGSFDTGGLIGGTWYGEIRDCSAMTGVDGDVWSGGLIGSNTYGSIINCWSKSSVTGGQEVGGLSGDNSGIVEKCYSISDVSCSSDQAGGLIGSCSGVVDYCFSDSNVITEDEGGGLVGRNMGAISNCYAFGNLTGSYYLGGLTGLNWEGTVLESYSATEVDGSGGGLIGHNSDGTVENSFWDIQVSGKTVSAGGTGLTTAEMQMESTFTDAGWDFVDESINGDLDIWRLCNECAEYPHLNWEYPSGDFGCPDGVNMLDFAILGDAWFSDPNMANWDPACDISEPNDNVIDGLDLGVFVGNWLEGM